MSQKERNLITRHTIVRATGLMVVALYATVLGWLLAAQPTTITEAVGGAAASVGMYAVDAQSFADGVVYFHNEQFAEARAAFARADPAVRDARTQFYVAYSFYREGWHRTHRDNARYRQGLAAVERAIAIAPGGRVVVDDSRLQMHSADELKAELESGLKLDASDFNPLRVFDTRK